MLPGFRLSHYALSNDPLPESLRSALNSHLRQLACRISALVQQEASIEDEILDLGSQVAALTSKLDALSRVHARILLQRAQAQEMKTQLEGAASPLRRVPAEVIARILSFALHTPTGLLALPQRQEFLQYRRVSNLWRATAFSTPSLWRGIRVASEDFSNYQRRRARSDEVFMLRLEECLSSWFSLAGRSAPLQLDVSYIAGMEVDDILNIIRKAGLNVASLSLTEGDYGGYFYELTDLLGLYNPAHPSPTITSLSLYLCEGFCAEGGVVIELTETFPSLSTFTVESDMAGRDRIYVGFKHQTLRRLRLHGVFATPIQFSTFLQDYPALESLCMSGCSVYRDEAEEQEQEQETVTFSHNTLKAITLGHRGPFEWFRGLTCPSLHLIRVEGNYGLGEQHFNDGNRLSDFINNFPAVHTVLDTSLLDRKSVIFELLERCPTIRTLEISSFSDFNPSTLNSDEDEDKGNQSPSPVAPFLIPSTLQLIRCWEEVAPDTFWSWAESVQRHLHPGHELQVEAPGCLKGIQVLTYRLPQIRAHSYLVSLHTYIFRADALFREGKFTFSFHRRRARLGRGSARLAEARHALKEHMMQKSLKGSLGAGRYQHH